MPVNQIVKAVASHFDCEIGSITKARRGRGDRNYPRWIAMKLSQDLSGLNLKTIARHFDVGNYCTISRTITRLNKELENRDELVEILNSKSKDFNPSLPSIFDQCESCTPYTPRINIA